MNLISLINKLISKLIVINEIKNNGALGKKDDN
jgi:hypothetical protein